MILTLRKSKKFYITTVILLLMTIGGGFFYFTRPVEGVTRTWDCGGGDSSWNNDLNWTGDTEPGASDIASFDTTCTNNVTIDKSISLAGMNIAAGYSGTITQSSTFTITIGASNWVQAGGTFSGGSGSISTPIFTLSGGTFTSTSGTVTIGNAGGQIDYFTISTGAVFNHNNGTVQFSQSSTNGDMNHYLGVNVDTSLTLYNVTVNSLVNGGTITLASGDTIVATNNFTQTNGGLGGAWEVQGNITIGATADQPGSSWPGTLTYTGSGSKTYTSSAGGCTSHLRINTATGSLSPQAGTTSLCSTIFSVLAGTFTAPSGTMLVGNASGQIDYFTVSSGAIFYHNNGTVEFNQSSLSGDMNHYLGVNVDTSLTLYSVTINPLVLGGTITVAGGDTIIVANNFTQTNGGVAGTWQVQGNYTVGASADGGTVAISLTGPNNQTYTDNGGNEPDGDITINKTAGSVTLASSADWNASGQDLTITSGLLIVPSTYSLSTTALTIGASGTLHWSGTGDLTLAGNLSNAGTIKMRSTTCGQDDLVLIRSSSNGVQRTWSGAGTFQMYDVDVRDQAGSASITAYSSTNTANNGANWTFSGAACPNIPPAFGLPSGVINLGTGRVNLR